MSAEHARPPLSLPEPLAAAVRASRERPTVSRPREVVATERLLKRALGPVAREMRARRLDLVCEVLPTVGDYVLGETRWLVEIVAGAARSAAAHATSGEVVVRLARQCAGFDASDIVLLTVVVRTADSIEEALHLELALPACAADDDELNALSSGARMLLVTPSAQGARIHSNAMTRFGIESATARDGADARDRLREASRSGKSFDVVVIDERLEGEILPLVQAIRTDPSLGRAKSLVTSSGAPEEEVSALAKAGAATMEKPVLPSELREAVIALRHDCRVDRRKGKVDASKIAAALLPPPQRVTTKSGTYRVALRKV